GIGNELTVKQPTGVEAMLHQNAVAPAMNSRHGGFIHAFCSHFEAQGAVEPFAFFVLLAQFIEETTILQTGVMKVCGGFHKARANTIAQLSGGDVCERYHQYFFGRWRARESVGWFVLAQTKT